MLLDKNMDLQVKVNSNANVVNPSDSEQTNQTESSQITVFENKNADIKNVKKLTEKEYKYLVALGLKPEQMSQEDINNALEPLYLQEQNVENQNKVNTEQQIKEDAAADTKNAETKPVSTKVVIDYNSDKNKTLEFFPDDTNVYACDFDGLTKADKETFFVKNLTKSQIGENWDKMSPEEQKAAMDSVETALAKDVPSWKDLTSEDKANLAKSFIVSSTESKVRFGDDYANTVSKSLNVQINDTAEKIIAKRQENELKTAEKTAFNEAVEARTGVPASQRGKQIWDDQFEYLSEKVKNNGGNIDSLNSYEKETYESLLKAKEFTGGKLRHLGTLSNDSEKSTFNTMKNSEIYHATLENLEHAEGAESDAEVAWFVSQFNGIDSKKKGQLFKKYLELRDNCSSLQEKLRLRELAEKVKGLDKQYLDNGDAVLGMVNASNSEDSNKQVDAAHKLAVSVSDGSVSDEAAGDITRAIPKNFNKEAVAPATIEVNRVSKASVNATIENLENKQYSVEQQYEIFNDVPKNSKLYKKENKELLAKNIGKTDDSIEMNLNENYIKFAEENKDADLLNAVGEGTYLYAKDNQRAASKNVMQASNSFEKEEAVKIQKTLADQIAKCHKDNQLDMHNDIMKSKYDDVLEYASSNINKYDESVQADAIKSTYATGNEKAIEACNLQIDKCKGDLSSVQNEINANVAQMEAKYAQKSAETVADVFVNISKAKDNVVTYEAQQENKKQLISNFMKADSAERYKMISKLPSNIKSDVYLMMCKYCPKLLSSDMIGDIVQMGYGRTILRTDGVSPSIKFELVHKMLSSDSSNKKIASNYVFENEAIFADATRDKALAVVQNTKIDNSDNKYASKPENLGNSNNNEEMKKLKQGFLNTLG